MHVLVIPDKFKGTLTAHAAANAIARGWKRARPKDRIVKLPMSDGGDGFGPVMGELLGAKRRTVTTVDAAQRPCKAHWWWQSKTKTAVIESATVIGLAMLPHGKFHPFDLDTFGLGTLLKNVLNNGARRIVIGIGGSATNDGGFGMARAMDWQFLNARGNTILKWPDLHKLAEIRPPGSRIIKKGVKVTVATDVQNLLLGKHGATRVYGPQKGLRPKDFKKAESALRQLAFVARKYFKCNFAVVPGTGAAGGLGFGLAAFLGATFESGFDVFAKSSGLSEHLRSADMVITAEGRIDLSSLMGKGAGQVAVRSHKFKVPCIGLAGCISKPRALKRLFADVHALTELTTAKMAKAQAAHWLEQLAEHVAAHAPFRR